MLSGQYKDIFGVLKLGRYIGHPIACFSKEKVVFITRTEILEVPHTIKLDGDVTISPSSLTNLCSVLDRAAINRRKETENWTLDIGREKVLVYEGGEMIADYELSIVLVATQSPSNISLNISEQEGRIISLSYLKSWLNQQKKLDAPYAHRMIVEEAIKAGEKNCYISKTQDTVIFEFKNLGYRYITANKRFYEVANF